MPSDPHTAGLRPDDTLDFGIPPLLPPMHAGKHAGEDIREHTARHEAGSAAGVAEWEPAGTPAGEFRLVPVVLERDLRLVHAWMNDPAVAAFWELAGPEPVTARHLRAQLEGDGHSVPCLGLLDGVPMSYWEVYRADLDPLAAFYPAQPHDMGLHVLIGGATDRGRGLGSMLLRTVGRLVLDHSAPCGRVIAEPDVRNAASVAAFLNAGFQLHAELDLPGKRAALMVLDRAGGRFTPPSPLETPSR